MNGIGKGYVQIYTGDGKGKTTAAIGLATRALGAGLRVYVAQFIKRGASSEFATLHTAGGERFKHEAFGLGRCIIGAPTQQEIDTARVGLDALRAILASGDYDLVIADEIFGSLQVGLFTDADIIALIAARPEGTELVLTGRNAPENIVAHADLVSEIKATKHYYTQGVLARKGIEF